MSEISKSELARKLSISKARVSSYVSRGLPVLANGKLDEGVALEWVKKSIAPRVESGSSAGAKLLTIRARRELARAELAELELAERRKGVVVGNSAVAIRQELELFMIECRQGVANRIASFLSHRLEQNRSPNAFLYMSDLGGDEIYWVVESIVDESLKRLSRATRSLQRMTEGELQFSPETLETISAIKMADEVARHMSQARDILQEIPRDVPPQCRGAVAEGVQRALCKLAQWQPGQEKP